MSNNLNIYNMGYRYDSHTQRYIGDFVRIGNNRWRVYHESGHADILTSASGDSTVYRYYVRDYLGSTRAVLAEDGTLLQDANYYPGGLSFSQLNDTEETDRLHCGKEWVDMEGLGWYDNTARFHDAILCRFTTPDPLAEQYPDLSPYSHCANNPLTYVDPTGMRLRVQDGDKYYYYHYDEDGYSGFYEETSGEAYNGDNEFIASLAKALTEISTATIGKEIINELVMSDNLFIFSEGNNGFIADDKHLAAANIEEFQNSHNSSFAKNGSGGIISWDSSHKFYIIDQYGNCELQKTYLSLFHEMVHASDANNGLLYHKDFTKKNSKTKYEYNSQ